MADETGDSASAGKQRPTMWRDIAEVVNDAQEIPREGIKYDNDAVVKIANSVMIQTDTATDDVWANKA